MKSIDFKDIDVKGDLAVRSGLNYSRLEGKWYRPNEVFKADSHGWPADWEGRIILALTMLSQSTHRTAAYLDEIIALIPEHLNEKGYFGKITEDNRFDEQHFGGHSWIIRALVEYYYWKKDEKVKAILEKLIKNFLMPSKGNFAKYPIEPIKRFEDQSTWILSKLQTKTKHHAETSDAGCAFIMLDGATEAYELFRWPELKELVEEMITRFMEMDFIKLHIQTHATLSGIRGIIRFYDIEKDPKYLEMAVKMFNLYKTEAWSEAYGNYNWFGAPRWTEPCAIIDSFMVAVQLWKYTRNPIYLEDAHRIYFNAVSHANRVNGSFGTDRCTGAQDTEDNLFIAPINYETYWCCTMRGGEGFARAIEYNFFIEGNIAYIPFYNSCTATVRFEAGSVSLEEKSIYPYDGKVSFKVMESSCKSAVKLAFFIPSWSNKDKITLYKNDEEIVANFEKGFLIVEALLNIGDLIKFDLGLSLRVEKAEFKNSVQGYHKFFFGPMLLRYKAIVEINSLEGNRFENYAESKYKSASEINIAKEAEFERLSRSEFKLKNSDVILACLCDVNDLTKEDSMGQVLFK